MWSSYNEYPPFAEQADPYLYRDESGCSLGCMFHPCDVDHPHDPVTPLIEAHAGDHVRIHVFGASREQHGMFTLEKHEWPIDPFLPGPDMISTMECAGSEGLDVFLICGRRNIRAPRR